MANNKAEIRFLILLIIFAFGVGLGFSMSHAKALTVQEHMRVCEVLFITHKYESEVEG